MSGWLVRFSPLLSGLVVAALWETASRLGWASERLLPPFSDVMVVLWGLLHDQRFLDDAGLTLQEIAIAFAITGPLGLGIGFWLGESAAAYKVASPILNLLLSIPKSIFLPIYIFALGIGFVEKVVFAVSLASFIVILSGIAAARSVPEGLVTAVRAQGASRRQIYLEVFLPAMEPLILEGLRMGLIFTITGVLVAEMYGSPRGIGRVIFAWGESYRMPELLAAVVLVVAFTVLCNEVMRAIEDWRRARRRGTG